VRFELKYYLTEKDYSRFVAVINEHPAGFIRSFPTRKVNNIYLDSPDLDSWHETQQGVSVRKKYRIRWYGDWDQLDKPALEIKMKENQLGSKEVHPLDPLHWSTLSDQIETIRKQFSLPDFLILSSTNFYTRSYFQSHCGLYRITIDRNLTYGSTFYSSIRPVVHSKWIVMELKYDLVNDDDSDWVKQFIPFQRSKFSKYVNSLGLID